MLEIWVMLVLEVMGVGSNTLIKVAMSKAQGLMSNYVFITSSFALAFFFLLPFTLLPFFRPRTNLHPKIACYIIRRIFLLALVSYCFSIFWLIGLSYSSPTLVSAMSNLCPAITFTIAVIFGMENLDLRSRTAQLKVVGTLVSVCGAITVTFYQGWPIIKFPSSSSPNEKHTLGLYLQSQPNWILGGFFLVAATLCRSLMYIIKTWIARDFNSDVTVTQISLLFMTTFAALTTLSVEKDYKAWLPNNHFELITIILTALVISASTVGTLWACKKKGPLFVVMFKPLEMIFAAIMGVFFLKDTLYFGRIGRTNVHPKITCYIIMRIFLLALATYCFTLFSLIGLSYSSPTLASTMDNLTPALTFTMAVIFRMEDLNLRSWTTQIKVVGTLVSISGAITVTFYQGWPIIIFPWSSSPNDKYTLHLYLQTQPNWILGGFFLVIATLCLSLMFIIKTWIARDFNSDVIIAQISLSFTTTFAALATLIAEKDYKAWLPNNHFELIAIIFTALYVSSSTVGTLWACKKKGPLFVAMFKPLEMIFAAIMGVFFLKDTLYFGSVVGGIIIALGFYTVMKGKADEEEDIQADKNRLIDKLDQVPSDSTLPLLLNKNMNV